MLKNKNRLIIPGHSVTSKDTKIADDYFNKVYINALKYYADDKSTNKVDLLFSAIFLYSLGDRQLFENGIGNVEEDESLIIETNFFSKNLVSSIQLRMKDRKYILDSNVYNMEELIRFFSLDIHTKQRKDHELFSLIVENFKENYVYLDNKAYSFEKHLQNLNSDRPTEITETNFSGLLDNNDFDDKFNKKEQDHYNFQLDSYLKSELKTWKLKYEKKSKIESLSSDIYPYVDTILFSNSDYFIILVATPSDENYIDDKTLAIDKVFDCTLNIYKNENHKMTPSNMLPFKEKLHSFIGKYINDCSLDHLQENMNGSIGEAADISRYWYSNGYEKLFDVDEKKEWEKKNLFHNSDNSIDFYTMLIETLLCEIKTDNLKIKNTEIYPFDRVFLIPDSGLSDDFKGVNNIQVLEAKMKSKDPFDRNGYIVGWEQDVRKNGKALIDEVDLVFSDKKVNKIKWYIPENHLSIFNYQRDKTIKPLKSHLNSNLLLSSVLLSEKAIHEMKQPGKEVEQKIYDGQKRTIRESFDDFGLHYSYEFGLDLKEAYPALFEMQQKYFKSMIEIDKEKDKDKNITLRTDDRTGVEYIPSDYPNKYRGVSENTLIESIIDNFDKSMFKSKVVTICFDPERIIGIDKVTQELLGLNSRITMVFVADKDPVKTTSELKSEEEDLKVLMQMVIRQIVYNAKLDQAIQVERKQLQTLLPQALHTVKGFIEDKDTRSRVDDLLVEYKAKFNRSLETTKDEYYTYSSDDNFANILKDLVKDEKKDVYQLVDTFKELDVVEQQNSNFDFKFHLNLSVLPNMEIAWDDITVPEAFHVLLKNSVQHAIMYGQNSDVSQVFISMSIEKIDQLEFLAINIINNTTPITEDRFNMLNDTDSDGMVANSEKSGSTGIGVALARKQLQIVNKNNGISFSMISQNMINVKMLLKINTLETKGIFSAVEVSTPIKQEMMTKVDVVYFEDTQEYYEETLNYLKTKRVEVFHSMSLETKYMKNAKLFLTDMSILNDNDEADELEGLAGIEEFRNLNENNAPICILSNASAVDIRSKVMEHLELSSSDEIIIIKDNTTILKNGFIHILDNEKVLTKEHIIIDNYLSKIEKDVTTDTEEETVSSSLVKFLKEEKVYGDDFLEHFDSTSSKDFLSTAISVKEFPLVTILDMWLNFKIPRLGKEGRKYTVSNVTYHKNTLLIIDDIELTDISEKWWINYLGITHNIIFNFNNLSHSVILKNWSSLAMKRESSGYLSKLRHDVKNYKTLYDKSLKDTQIISIFDNIMENTLNIQRVLKSAQYESIKVYIEAIHSGIKIDTKLFVNRDEIHNRTLNIKDDLLMAINILNENSADAVNIENLQAFKSLTELYIDFSTNQNGVK